MELSILLRLFTYMILFKLVLGIICKVMCKYSHTPLDLQTSKSEGPSPFPGASFCSGFAPGQELEGLQLSLLPGPVAEHRSKLAVCVSFSFCKTCAHQEITTREGQKAGQIALLTELKGSVGESLATYQVISHLEAFFVQGLRQEKASFVSGKQPIFQSVANCPITGSHIC